MLDPALLEWVDGSTFQMHVFPLEPRQEKRNVHAGSGMPALGERDAAKLAAMIPAEAQYVGIGVGRRWNQAMMKQAASRTGGLSTQINPDEEIAWRAFDVSSNLHLPRLVDLAVRSEEREFESSISRVSPLFGHDHTGRRTRRDLPRPRRTTIAYVRHRYVDAERQTMD